MFCVTAALFIAMGVHAIDYPLPHTRSGSGSRSFHKKPESVLLMDISVLFRKRHMSEFDLSLNSVKLGCGWGFCFETAVGNPAQSTTEPP